MTSLVVDISDWAMDNPTKCLLCLEHRTAYSWPPVCENCREEFEIECAIDRSMLLERDPLPLLAMGCSL